MGAASPEYCRKTPVSRMGFSQRSSCKAQGFLPRTGKSNRGKRVVSPKYRAKSPGKNTSLYDPGKRKPRTKTGYKDRETAVRTLENVYGKDLVYQKQVVTTMYNRAKHHQRQTAGMREAMKVYRVWMRAHGVRT